MLQIQSFTNCAGICAIWAFGLCAVSELCLLCVFVSSPSLGPPAPRRLFKNVRIFPRPGDNIRWISGMVRARRSRISVRRINANSCRYHSSLAIIHSLHDLNELG